MILAVKAWLKAMGWEVWQTDHGPDACLDHGIVWLRDDLSEKQELICLLHEGAHIKFGHDAVHRRGNRDRDRNEVFAETAALWCARELGLDMEQEAEVYLAGFPAVHIPVRVEQAGIAMAEEIRAWM